MILKVLGLVIVGFVIYFIFFKKSRQNDIAKKDKMITFCVATFSESVIILTRYRA